MKKAANTYWNRSRAGFAPARNRKSGSRGSSTPQWFVFVVVVSISSMLCLAINLRAYSEMKAEAEQNIRLSSEVEKMSVENLQLQEEIHNLKNDSETVEREARRMGLGQSR